jgi:serine phosphatase RsbU (regulator of sigma subunit)/anti-sigma regulatory factor (Ser/Thr protein kinase)
VCVEAEEGTDVPIAVMERVELVLDSSPAAVRAARAFVEREVLARGAIALADDAALVAAELLANAVQHGTPPVWVAVNGGADRIRLEVRDGNPRPPVQAAGSTTNMTGRGLGLIASIATRWGIERTEDTGKIVWAELTPGHQPLEPDLTGTAIDELLDEWIDATGPLDLVPRYSVILGDVPTDLLIDAKSHIDNLVREFSLATTGAEFGVDVPEHLAQLIRTVVHGFAEARDAIKRQALAALRRGEVRTRLRLELPESAADAGEAYLAALDETDAYARAARLLTLETPPAHRLFRHWYVDAVVSQIRDLASGRSPAPVVPFENRMLEEIERLEALQRTTSRAARLQRVTAALANARTPEDVADVVVSEGVTALDAAGGGLLVPAEDGTHLEVPGTVGYGAELVGALREERLDAPLPAATALRTGAPVWLESREERDRRYPTLRGFEATTVSMCAVPLRVGARILGALRFSFTSRRFFDADEREFVLALAAQTAQTLLRTETYAAERAASVNLQRALLPDRTPPIPGWSVAAHYSPAGQEEAGGDFYDVLPLGDGRVVAVVGDVMGRGVEAAAAMAQVRTIIRAYAAIDPAPVAVLTKVDRYFAVLDRAQLVTALYLLIDATSGEVSVATAGHLPPIVVTVEGSFPADTVVGTPLGIEAEERRTTSLSLPQGSGLVLLTDGLVERRGEDIDEGIDRIVAGIGRTGDMDDAADLLIRAVAAAPPDGQDDDVTVLALYRH